MFSMEPNRYDDQKKRIRFLYDLKDLNSYAPPQNQVVAGEVIKKDPLEGLAEFLNTLPDAE